MKTAVTRRRALVAGGTAVAGATAVGLASTDRASAAVETTQISIPDTSRESDDGSVTDVTCAVTGTWSFTTDTADHYRLALLVASGPDAGDYQQIDSLEDGALATSTGGQFDLRGSLLAHDALTGETFSAAPAETTTREIPVRVELTVYDAAETVLTEAAAVGTATIAVTNTSVAVDSAVQGDGSVSVDL